MLGKTDTTPRTDYLKQFASDKTLECLGFWKAL